ncbi:MAG: cation:proton antiporter [Myxococcota bacterium]
MKIFDDPSLAVAFALSLGLLVQIIARHVGLPGIVLLLTTGVILGPDLVGIVRPDALGSALQTLVGFAVAVILFEGGLNLSLSRLREAAQPIRQLIVIGAPVSAVLATGVGYFILGWAIGPSILFGLLAMVTGPTVINPLMKRLKVKTEVAEILEAEGVLIDAIGAIAAAAALEVVVGQANPVTGGLLDLVGGLAFGTLLGIGVGAALAWTLRRRRLIPEGLENVFTLTVVLVAFQIANALFHESGLATVTTAGLLLGNIPNSVHRELREFKEQLTVMLLGMLFVLLAADVRLADVFALGPKALLGVLAMLFIVRPLSVFAGTFGTPLKKRQRAFMAWIGPRGIVAAAVASYFSSALEKAGDPQGSELRAFVFVVIAVSVLAAGLTGGWVASWLGQRAEPRGWLILGAHEVSRQLATILKRNQEPVLLLDSNLDAVRHARSTGLKVLHGNALDEEILREAGVSYRRGIVAMTANEEVNLLFSQEARGEASPALEMFTVVSSEDVGITSSMVKETRAQLYSASALDIELWDVRLRRGSTRLERWSLQDPGAEITASGGSPDTPPDNTLLFYMARERSGIIEPLGEETSLRVDDVLWVMINRERQREAYSWLESRGLRALRDDEPEAVAATDTTSEKKRA